MKRFYYLISLFLFILSANANHSWQQVDLTYTQQINNKNHLAEVTLIRPSSYFIQNNVTKSSDNLVVNLPEMGLNNVAMQVLSILPYKGIATKDSSGNIKYRQIDEINWNDEKYRPVTATFKRYAGEVYTYKFKNTKTDQISKIHVTPNHPFYVTNLHDYIPIEQVTPNDTLLSQNGDLIKLECPNYTKTANCGIKYNVDNKPILVYNFEVYENHRYFVSGTKHVGSILVHNPCGKVTPIGTIKDYEARIPETPVGAENFRPDRTLAFSRIKNKLEDKLIRVDTREVTQIKKTGFSPSKTQYRDHVYKNSISTSLYQGDDNIINAYNASAPIVK